MIPETFFFFPLMQPIDFVSWKRSPIQQSERFTITPREQLSNRERWNAAETDFDGDLAVRDVTLENDGEMKQRDFLHLWTRAPRTDATSTHMF